ncbi:MAG: hypothetical protein IJR49_02310, partial [Treponema sp.]|nr:hypothetical protein [Treponema sp.]
MKTKYKSNSEHNLAFRIAVFLCLCGIAFCSYLFYKNFFRSLTKLNEAPIATITFKKKVAQRKFIDRVVWDRLQQNSPIYNGDTVRTAELSGALVSFASGAVLELEENTLAQFFQNDDGSFSANLGGGSFTAQAAEDGSVLSVSSGGQTLSMSQGASLFMQQQENGVQLNILSGSASFADGASIEEGEALSMDEDGYTFSPLKVTSPAPSAKILYISKNNQGTHPVRFAWRKSEDYTNLCLTISKDSLYENVLRRFNVSRFTEYTVPLSSGSYYWKFEDEANTLVSRGKITLSQTYLPKITSPVNNAHYEYSSSFPEIKFAWEGIEDARS